MLFLPHKSVLAPLNLLNPLLIYFTRTHKKPKRNEEPESYVSNCHFSLLRCLLRG